MYLNMTISQIFSKMDLATSFTNPNGLFPFDIINSRSRILLRYKSTKFVGLNKNVYSNKSYKRVGYNLLSMRIYRIIFDHYYYVLLNCTTVVHASFRLKSCKNFC